MKKYKRILILVNLIILFGLFNNSIIQKETLLSNGKLILLELAPVDPRSLMQGDYMRLRYAMAENNDQMNIPKRGYCVVKLEKNGVAKRIRLQENVTPINNNEYLIKFNKYQWGRIGIGAESFFFQEGTGNKYQKAKYGGLKVDKNGNSLLIGLFDEHKKIIN